MRSFLTLFSLCYVSVTYASIGPSTNLFIENKIISPDGFNRSAVLAGGTNGGATFPGPVISGQKGSTFNINVVNQLTDTSMRVSTSIHWHGLFEGASAWADGPVGVTQCPIAPSNSFLYTFTARQQAGTYWYHSHYSTQYCDGLRGPLVVYDPNDPYQALYDVDDDTTVITLADWYHSTAAVLTAAGGPPTPDATLINGLGRSAPNTVATPLTVISVTHGKRYRFRLVSISCDPNFIFSIDNHTMTVIEADGNNVLPVVVDSIQIYAGQRYSFILTADKSVNNYWIRSEPNNGPQGFAGGVNSAILRYVGAPVADPSTPQVNSVIPLLETNLHPLTSPAAPSPAAPGPPVPASLSNGAVMPLAFNMSFDAGAFLVNGVAFAPPSVPVLLQILNGVPAQSLLPTGSVYVLPPNTVIEVSIPGGTIGAPHPIHLHGHAFSVIRSAGSNKTNYFNPVQRDVVNTGVSTSDLTVIRFMTNNAGPWIMHCHIDWHLDRGLAIVMAENVTGIAQETHPAAWDQLCPTFNALPAQNFPAPGV